MRTRDKLRLAVEISGATYKIGLALFSLFYSVRFHTTWDDDIGPPFNNPVKDFRPRKKP